MQLETVYRIFTDGGSRGNPGPAAIGVVIESADGVSLATFGRPIGIATNNIAEVSAVIAALEWLKQQKLPESGLSIRFYLDSELVVRQLTGDYRVKNLSLMSLYQQIHLLSKSLRHPISYEHISREQNKKADRLVNTALDLNSAISE